VLNETHDPRLRSWLESANEAQTDFPLQNLPFGVFRRAGSDESFRGGVALGDQIIDLSVAARTGALSSERFGVAAAQAASTAATAPLNDFMAAGRHAWSALRLALSRAFRLGSPQEVALRGCLVPQANAEFSLPAHIGDYTDFYSSIYHATAVGRLFRPDQPLMPNYRWLPVAYHGRSSSIGISGQYFPRPRGQALRGGSSTPSVAPSERLDYELELAAFIGPGNELGQSIELNHAEAHVFGLCLLNDWSARDLQAWESQPLGPFQGKNFATTISPWIVTLEALAPYRSPWRRPADDPPALPYLDSEAVRAAGALDIELEVCLQTERMRAQASAPQQLSRSNFREAYWTIAQMVAHHTLNGCNLRPGDLLGTGTQSGAQHAQAGSLLELTRAGREPLQLACGEQRRFLEDGDTVTMRAWCERVGYARLGFGALLGGVLPARDAGD
jgi:fumarylacetoacetase